jgi:hypothetical protein
MNNTSETWDGKTPFHRFMKTLYTENMSNRHIRNSPISESSCMQRIRLNLKSSGDLTDRCELHLEYSNFGVDVRT